MHLSSISSFKLIWLLLPAFSVAATLPVTVGGSTTIGTGPINLVTPQQPQNTTLDHDKKAYCKHDDDYHHNFIYNSSRGLPFPDFSRSEVIVRSADDHPFDCFLELLDGYVTLEINGDIDSTGVLEFFINVNALFWKYEFGPWRCSLFELDKDPCAFNVDSPGFSGQGGLFPEDDADPAKEDLCLKLDVNVKFPFTRSKHLYLNKCFWKFPRDERVKTIS